MNGSMRETGIAAQREFLGLDAIYLERQAARQTVLRCRRADRGPRVGL
jgi:hypothetical protein